MDNNTLTLNVIAKPDHSDFDQTSLKVTRKGATFGRKSENTHTLPDSEKIISSYHAAISLVDGKFTLTDTSTNGTIVNEAPITFPKALAHGDVITIGKYQFSVDLGRNNELNSASASHANNSTNESTEEKNASSFLDELAIPTPSGSPDLSHNKSSSGQPSNGNHDILNTQNDPFAEFLAPKPIAPPSKETTYKGSTDGLDQWLEPSEHKVDDSLFSPSVNNNIAAGDQSLIGDEITDPLIALNQASEPSKNTISNLIGETDVLTGESDQLDETSGEEQWWLESGSHGDHASPINQAVSAPAQHHSETHHQQRQPWELEDIQPHSIEDFLADSEIPSQNTSHNQLNETDSALDRWLSQCTNSGTKGPSEASIFSSPTNHDKEELMQTAGASQQSSFQNNGQGKTDKPQSQAQYKSQNSYQDSAPNHSHLTQALAAELGLNRLTDQEQARLIPEVSAILKETTSRLLEVLIARSNVKNEMRLERTMIKTSENNPLKFSVSGDDALQNLLAPRSAAFLSGKDAITEAFDDLADHQIALLSGMREAYHHMLNHFSPDAFIDTAQTTANTGIFKGNGKAKQWDAFKAKYESLQKDQETAYNQLFGDRFNRAYEEKITALKVLRQNNKPM